MTRPAAASSVQDSVKGLLRAEVCEAYGSLRRRRLLFPGDWLRRNGLFLLLGLGLPGQLFRKNLVYHVAVHVHHLEAPA